MKNAVSKREATSVGLVGNCADLIPELAKRGVVPDLADGSDERARSHRRICAEWHDAGAALELRKNNPQEYRKHAIAAMARARSGHAGFAEAGRGDV